MPGTVHAYRARTAWCWKLLLERVIQHCGKLSYPLIMTSVDPGFIGVTFNRHVRSINEVGKTGVQFVDAVSVLLVVLLCKFENKPKHLEKACLFLVISDTALLEWNLHLLNPADIFGTFAPVFPVSGPVQCNRG